MMDSNAAALHREAIETKWDSLTPETLPGPDSD